MNSKKITVSNINYSLIFDFPDVSVRILILDTLDLKLAT